jgi:hypothetical protein
MRPAAPLMLLRSRYVPVTADPAPPPGPRRPGRGLATLALGRSELLERGDEPVPRPLRGQAEAG